MAFAKLATLLCSVFFSTTFVRAEYAVTQDYTGTKFYDEFTFYNESDPTHGYVDFLSKQAANSSNLAGLLAINGSQPNVVYLGVDHTTNLSSTQGRNGLRVNTNQTWNHALVIADILHMPGGTCGTWPAFWMLGTASEWPKAGEIDIIEGVNSQSSNIMTLHTNAGVTATNDSSLFSGNLTTANCDVADPNQPPNQGCSIADSPSSESFGKVFNSNGGGVYAMEWTSDHISVWFFNRTHIPANVLSSSPNPSSKNSTWGTPKARFQPSTKGVIDDHFKDLQIIFDTTFCGDWAGQAWTSDLVCSKLAPTCEDYVSGNPQAFKEAYWAINSLKVFQDSKN